MRGPDGKARRRLTRARPRRDPCLSLAEAAQRVGFEGEPRYASRRLFRLVIAKERETRKHILIRTRGPRGRLRYRVTMWELKRSLPKLFDRRDDAETAARLLVREEIRQLLTKMASMDIKITYLGKRLAAMIRQNLMSATDRNGPSRTAKKTLSRGRGTG